MPGGQIVAREEGRLLKGSGQDQLIPQTVIVTHPTFAPRPDLRCDVVHALPTPVDWIAFSSRSMKPGLSIVTTTSGRHRGDVGDHHARSGPADGAGAAASPAGPSRRGLAAETGWQGPAPPYAGANPGEGEFWLSRSECGHQSTAQHIAAQLASDQIDQWHYDSACPEAALELDGSARSAKECPVGPSGRCDHATTSASRRAVPNRS